MNSTLGTVVSLLLGAAMVYLGLNLVRTSIVVFADGGPVLLGFGLGVVGIALLVLPLLVLLSQVRALIAHRRSGRA